MKTFVTFLGSALIVAASVQFAAAAQRYHYKPDRVVVRQQPTINSYAAAGAGRFVRLRPELLLRRLLGARRSLTPIEQRDGKSAAAAVGFCFMNRPMHRV
jgi:hypothetical protein